MPHFDLLVRGATVYPGDGPPAVADVAVAAGRISAMAPQLPSEQAARDVKASGLMLCPGFIDLHAHTALQPFRDPLLAAKVGQGFTTELINADGLSPAPVEAGRVEERRVALRPIEGPGPERWTWSSVADYLEALDATRPATTLVASAAHNAVRDHVMAGAARPPSVEELRAMRREVRAALEAGARALSFGLVYPPGVFSATDELVALAREAAGVGAPLVPHVRNEAAGVLEAVAEMVAVARRSGAPLHLSHLKAIGDPSLVERLLDLIDRAATDVDISFDQYPYGAGASALSALLPPWAQEGGPSALLARLTDPSERHAIARDVARGLPGWENLLDVLGPQRVVIVAAAPPRDGDIGKTLAALADERGVDHLTATLDLLLDTRLDVTSIDHYAEESVVKEIARHPRQLVGSDAIFSTHPHPRLYGTAPRLLGRWAIREGLIPVEEAVARLTARAADRLGLADRGRVREGLRADLVLLDPERFIDVATFEEPEHHPEGLVMVVAGGEVVWEKGPTGACPGGVVREPLPSNASP